MVIGHPGAGKSTLAIELGRILDLPVIHLDREYWQPGWVELTDNEWEDRVTTLASQGRWVMDGSYDRTLRSRLPRAEIVLLLDFPRLLCMRRIIKRILTGWGKVRTDMGDGCPEKIDFGFFKFVWNYRRDRMPNVKSKLAEYFSGGKLFRFDHPADIDQLLKELRSSESNS